MNWIDSLTYKQQTDNKSFGRTDDGGSELNSLTNPTPGAANSVKQITNIVTTNEIAVYPNITQSEINIYQKEPEKGTVTIYSMLGSIVQMNSIQDNTKSIVNVSGLPGGLYFVNIKTSSVEFSTKIIVKR